MYTVNNISVSFSSKRGRVVVFRAALRAIGEPSYIRFLMNMKDKKVAVQACEAIDRDSFHVHRESYADKNQYEISSLYFVSMVYKMAGWDLDKTYRIKGTVYAKNHLVEFLVDDAEVIQEEELDTIIN